MPLSCIKSSIISVLVLFWFVTCVGIVELEAPLATVTLFVED